ncbi:hypothetical protein D9X91_06020 [Falsibacillus albus]|uniref:Uncharacterized protein n=1 Tax=Falsibacillus albus TaxID=2478915 RepID=A0A3L7K0R0_9BACI|nr:hypothetical protein D9X91_06020 [Falsibacillus albus]
MLLNSLPLEREHPAVDTNLLLSLEEASEKLASFCWRFSERIHLLVLIAAEGTRLQREQRVG